jgi:hypothetical protein
MFPRGLTVDAMAIADICKLFCCPPVPSRIAGKLAFLPPKPPSYKIECVNQPSHGVNAQEQSVMAQSGAMSCTCLRRVAFFVASCFVLTRIIRDGTIRRDELYMLAEGGVYRQRSLPSGTSLHTFRSQSGNTIAAFFIQCTRRPAKLTFLWSHANALDIGQVCFAHEYQPWVTNYPRPASISLLE